jgi:hypothetical protein
MASRSYRAVRMRSAVQNEFAEPCEPSEIKLKASLGIRLACMESYHPQAIYHRPACVRSGLASPQRAEMDLQKPCQVRSGGLIEARSCELPKLVKWIQQQKDRLRAVFRFQLLRSGINKRAPAVGLDPTERVQIDLKFPVGRSRPTSL